MPDALVTWFEAWWTRLFSRPADAASFLGIASDHAEPVLGGPAHRSHKPADAARAAARSPAAAARAGSQDAECSLREMLRVAALPQPAPRPKVFPGTRQRTLEALQSLRQIPALQSLAQGFTRVLNRPEVAVEEVVGSIEKDSALCVRVLRMANSVLVCPERKIEDLESAVQMLGVLRVRKAAHALFTLRDAHRVAEGFDWRHLWMHALATGAIADELEQQLRANDDSQVYLAALLHDVGKIVLSTLSPDVYRDILVTAWNEGGRLEDLERERLGVDHREAGMLFARYNQLPPVVVAASAHHHEPQAAPEHRFEVALVAIANYVSKAHGLGFSGARLGPHDGEFGELPAWDVVADTCGWRPDTDAIEEEMGRFVVRVREDLWAMRESV